MKERLATLGLALAALFLFYALFLPKPTPHEEEISQPLSTERGPNGYLALQRWLEAEHVRVTSLRERYDKLAQASVAASGNLLITTMPHRLNARRIETAKLREWIERGNTLLVMAGLADTPEWAMDAAHRGNLVENLQSLVGIEFYAAHEQKANGKSPLELERQRRQRMNEAFQKLLQSDERRLVPTGVHPLLSGVAAVKAISEYPADEWRARPKEAVTAVVELAHMPASGSIQGSPALWIANFGKGQIIVSGFASPFVNKLIDKGDNARLLSNIVAWSVAANGAVVIDDAHQGAVAFYDPQAFFRDARLYRALGWVLLLWLVFVLGPTRLRATPSQWNPVDIISFVRATGGFMARTLRPDEAGRRALALFFNGIRRRLGLQENGAPVWEWLEGQSKVAPRDLARLREYEAQLAAGKRIDFANLHNLLCRVEGSFI